MFPKKWRVMSEGRFEGEPRVTSQEASQEMFTHKVPLYPLDGVHLNSIVLISMSDTLVYRVSE